MNWPGEQLIIRLWETLSEKGIGTLLKPWQIKREGIAHLELRRAELLALAQTEKDAEDIRTGLKRLEDFSVDLNFAAVALTQTPLQQKPYAEHTIDLPSVVEAAARQTIEDSVRRQVNVANAIAHAEEALREDAQEPPKETIDDDWLFRWRDYAGDVSSESMQHLWGKILAGELKSPTSFSLRSLDFLRNISPDEAKTIEILSRFVIDGCIWRDAKPLLEAENIPFATLLAMQDLGVISGVESVGLERTWMTTDQDNFISALRSNGKVLVVRHEDSKKKLKIRVYLLTSIGQQILRLVQVKPHIEYLQKLGRTIQTQGFTVTVGDILHDSETIVQFYNEVQIKAEQGT